MIENEKKGRAEGIPAIRTFRSDVAARVKKAKISAVDMAAAEAARAERSPFPRVERRKNRLALAAVLLFLAGAAALAAVFALSSSGGEGAARKAVLPEPPIVPDATLEIRPAEIPSAVSGPPFSEGLVYFRVVVGEGAEKRLASAREALASIGASPPPGFFESLTGELMLVSFSFARASLPALVFGVRSYPAAFAAMMKWEKRMAEDLAPALGIGSPLPEAVFTDEEIWNRDARALKNADGETILVYSFVNRKYLAVASSEEALKEIFRRFTVAKYLR